MRGKGLPPQCPACEVPCENRKRTNADPSTPPHKPRFRVTAFEGVQSERITANPSLTQFEAGPERFSDDKSFVAAANATEDNPGFVFYFVFEGDYILSSPRSADVDYVPVSLPHSDVPMPPQYEGKPHHFYGAASKPLHVEGDMDGVTIEVPEPTAKEAQMFKAMQEQEQQNQSGAPK